MSEILAQAVNISKDYSLPGAGTFSALLGINCQIHDGTHIAIIGPSGSGKSTLFHILGGLIEPTAGLMNWPALGSRKTLQPEKIQFVFQSPSLFPPLTAAQNVALPLVLAGKSANPDAIAANMLIRLGLNDLSDKLPEELSGGQAQRIAMARALAISPRLVLADEPTGQLDSTTAAGFLGTVLEIIAEIGAALLIATHDQSVAARMDQQWVLEHGRLYTQPSERELS